MSHMSLLPTYINEFQRGFFLHVFVDANEVMLEIRRCVVEFSTRCYKLGKTASGTNGKL